MYSYLIFLFFVFSIAPVINKVLNWKLWEWTLCKGEYEYDVSCDKWYHNLYCNSTVGKMYSTGSYRRGSFTLRRNPFDLYFPGTSSFKLTGKVSVFLMQYMFYSFCLGQIELTTVSMRPMYCTTYFISHFISFLLKFLARMPVCLFPEGSCSQALGSPVSSPANRCCVPEHDCQGDQSAHQSPVIKNLHSLLLFIFPEAHVSLQRLFKTIYPHCKKCPLQQKNSVSWAKWFPKTKAFFYFTFIFWYNLCFCVWSL